MSSKFIFSVNKERCLGKTWLYMHGNKLLFTRFCAHALKDEDICMELLIFITYYNKTPYEFCLNTCYFTKVKPVEGQRDLLLECGGQDQTLYFEIGINCDNLKL